MLRGYDRRLFVGLALAVVVAAAGSTVGMAAASGAFAAAPGPTASASNCAVPPLPGTVIDVTLTDMGAWMSGSANSGAGWMRGGMMGAPMTGPGAGGMMRVLVTPDAVTVGTVSLRVRNTGAMTHELVVLPLSDGQVTGAPSSCQALKGCLSLGLGESRGDGLGRAPRRGPPAHRRPRLFRG